MIKYLVIKTTGDVRVTQRRPSPQWGEAVYRLNITIPDSWGTVLGDISLTMPPPPEVPTITLVEEVNDAS